MGAVAVISGRRVDVSRLVASVVLAFAVVMIGYAVVDASTGRDQSNLPPEIERIQPAAGDKVLNQTPVIVDLIAGYGGRLEIDGVALPTVSTQQQEPTGNTLDPSTPTTVPVVDPNVVRFDAGTNTLSYQPRPGADMERFDVGRHVVKVLYWKLIEGEAAARSYTWFFDVTA